MAKKLSAEEREYNLLKANIRELLKLRVGREFIWFVLSVCDIYGSHFTGNSTTFYNEGKRAVGLEVLSLLEDSDPTAYARLLLDKQKQKENNND